MREWYGGDDLTCIVEDSLCVLVVLVSNKTRVNAMGNLV